MFATRLQNLRHTVGAAFGAPAGPTPAPAPAQQTGARPGHITWPRPDSAVGYVHLADRKAQPLQLLKLAATAVIADMAGRAGQRWSATWLGTGDTDRRVYTVASALGGLAAVTAGVVVERLYDLQHERAERQQVAAQGLTPRQQIERVVELANAQPLNASGLKRCVQRLAVLHAGHFPQAGGPARLAGDLAALGAGAVHVPRTHDATARATCEAELRLLTGAIRSLHGPGGITRAECVAALRALQHNLQHHNAGGHALVQQALSALVDAEIAAVPA